MNRVFNHNEVRAAAEQPIFFWILNAFIFHLTSCMTSYNICITSSELVLQVASMMYPKKRSDIGLEEVKYDRLE